MVKKKMKMLIMGGMLALMAMPVKAQKVTKGQVRRHLMSFFRICLVICGLCF